MRGAAVELPDRGTYHPGFGDSRAPETVGEEAEPALVPESSRALRADKADGDRVRAAAAGAANP